MKFSSLTTRSIVDSRGMPTMEVSLSSESGTKVTASVPSGKSTGSKEAAEKRDKDGRGVEDALSGIERIIAPALAKQEFQNPHDVDELLLRLDGTENKANLGGNTLVAVSIAAYRLFAAEDGLPLWRYIAETHEFTPRLPKLFVNMIEGGVHARWASAFQEHWTIIDTDDGMERAYALTRELYATLGKVLSVSHDMVPMGDEGGYAPQYANPEEPLKTLFELTDDIEDVALGIDAAASELYKEGEYVLQNVSYSRRELLKLYERLVNKYRLLAIEDPFAEHDTEGFTQLTDLLGFRTLIVGDDLTTTKPELLRGAVQEKAGNALIIKPNQIGTLTEVFDAVKIAKKAGWDYIASHRSGETADTWISDIAVGVGAFGIKPGALSQPERRVKYERLIRIEEEMKKEQREKIKE